MAEESLNPEAGSDSALPAPVRALAAVDVLHVVVLVLLLAASPLAIRRGGADFWLPVGYAGLAVLIWALAVGEAAHPRSRLLGGAHFWYPLASVPLVFWSLYWIVPGVNPGPLHDSLLISWDRAIFGFDVIAWHRTLETPVLTDVMHLFYLSYFFLPVLLVAWLLRAGRRKALSESIFVLCLSFFLCYAGYVALPAAGPRFAVYGSNHMNGWVLTQPLRDLIDSLEPSKADAFPSAHAAVTLVVLVLALRHARRLGLWLVPVTIGILASLVYARYHYAVDVLAGAVWAAVALTAGPVLHAAWERAR